VETGYVEPDRATTTALVEQLLKDAGTPRDAAAWEWVRAGSSSLVVLSGDVAVRVARDDGAAADLRRSRDLVAALPSLPFAVARPIGEVAELDGVVAAAAARVPGTARPPGPADPAQLRALLDAIHGLDPHPLRAHLAPARAFFGGADWYAVLTEVAIPLLPVGVQDRARAAVDSLADLEHPEIAVNHGDLAGSNVHWEGERVVGVLDWDLAALDDPAEDVASLLGWHGWALGPQVADAATLARAEVFRAVSPLTVIGFAALRGRPEAEVDRLTARVAARLGRA
jgi:aminoglycoside phosphotransferase (APT) family kinase protein